jgi:hypothetical protein
MGVSEKNEKTKKRKYEKRKDNKIIKIFFYFPQVIILDNTYNILAMSYGNHDDAQTNYYLNRGYGQQNYVPQTMMHQGYNNNHVKNNARTSDGFTNSYDYGDSAHAQRFTKTYASRDTMNRAGNLRFISKTDER